MGAGTKNVLDFMSYDRVNLSTLWGCCRRGSCGPCAPYISATCGRINNCGWGNCGIGNCGIGNCGISNCGVGGCGGIPVGVGTGSCGAAIGTFIQAPWGGSSACCPGFSCRSRCNTSFASGCCSPATVGYGCNGCPNF
jgi:hypothetical protein